VQVYASVPCFTDGNARSGQVGEGWAEEPDAIDFRSRLRARRERPRRRTAEQRDELAAFQLIELHSIPANQAGL
jgi:hypothetical protein